ncbi:altronate dehydratase [Marinilabiliaceae bacterium JC017]|nr:altronate dehydratase [Marinilabiliaceae bacterium JC017]
MTPYIHINKKDNVLVALQPLQSGTTIQHGNHCITVHAPIEAGHKVALVPIQAGEAIIKYGFPIGVATSAIQPGEWIHTHNIKSGLDKTLEYEYCPCFSPNSYNCQNRVFQGYERPTGEVGIRNELWVVPTVGCVNGTADQIVAQFKSQADTSHIDGIGVFRHQFGCSQLGDDHANTRQIIANIIRHPNAGGVLVLGLGCENNNIEELKAFVGETDPSRVKYLVAQEVEDEIVEGVKLLHTLSETMKADTRTSQPISALKVGLKCGGSDGFSGITANPLLGEFSDWLIAQGGTTILTEVPEMFGAETILMERAQNKEVFNGITRLINGFKEYYMAHNQPVYENPSPGNKAGGISTLEEKSLGCTQKGGLEKVTAVLSYGDRLTTPGLNLLQGPGNDLVSVTAMGAAGCQLVLFTTGRGTPFGSFIPTLKVATNTNLFRRKANWMDFNAGDLIEGQIMAEKVEELVNYIITVASGTQLKHETINFKEIAIFKNGVTL